MFVQQFAVSWRFIVEAEALACGADSFDTGPTGHEVVVRRFHCRRQVQ
jgi:hypothetical protein